MDEKKKNVAEEFNKDEESTTVLENSEVVDFDDVHNQSTSPEKKSSSTKKEKTGKIPDEMQTGEKEAKTDKTKQTLNMAKEVKAQQISADNLPEHKENESKDAKADEKENDSKKPYEKQKEKTSEDDKTVQKESVSKDAETEKEENDSKKSCEKQQEKASEDDKTIQEENVSKDAKKKENNPEKEKDKIEKEEKSQSGKENINQKKETESGNKAISQSKKLADVNAAKENTPLKSMPAKKHDRVSAKKVAGIVCGCIAAVLLIAYFAGFIYFSGHFYQNVTVNGFSVTGLSTEDARQSLNEFYTNYILTIHTVDKKRDLTIAAKDLSMQIQMRDEFRQCIQKQKAYLWFVNMFKKYEFKIGADVSWDAGKLKDFYDSCEILNKKNMKKPADAYVGVEDGKFAIIDEVVGSTLSMDKFKKTVESSLSEVLPEVDLMEAGCYVLPKVYADDEELKKELDAKNEYAKNEIKIQMDDLTLEPEMELYEEILKKNGDSYAIDDNKVKNYVVNLAKQYDTVNTTRVFETSFDNKKIETLGKSFGYELDQEATLAALEKALKAGKSATVEAVFKSKGATLQGDNDIGNTYIEVNLSEQKVAAYQNGKKVAEGDCVSGNESIGHGTCIGLYAIQGKQSPSVLRGEKKPVTKTVTKKKKGKKVKVTQTSYEYEYESPVTFWMPFNGGIGLHDAAGWRSSYGGSIYLYNGSHGCVNLPYSLAETLYNTFDIGTPVVVYFWDNENRK